MKTPTRYLLLQIPGLLAVVLVMVVLRWWFDLPGWVLVTVPVLWVAKDLALYPLVRSAYEVEQGLSPRERLVGADGVAEQDLAPSGFVRVRGELWRARASSSDRPVRRGEAVTVRAVEGSTLLVSLRARDVSS